MQKDLTVGKAGSNPAWWRWLWLALALATVGRVAPCLGQGQVSKEYQIKAAFLYHFVKFVQWPAERFQSPTDPIVIGVYGKNPFGTELDSVAKGRKIEGREIQVRHGVALAELADCHIVFIPAGADGDLKAILSGLQSAGALTVGETDSFIGSGGMIGFVPEGDKIRFQINVAAAEKSRIKISGQLQKLAKPIDK